jgi:hypothetical protein
MSRKSSKWKNEQRSITPKVAGQSYGSFALRFYWMRSIYLQRFLWIPPMVLQLCPGHVQSEKYEQRSITLKLEKAQICFFCTAILPNENYILTKFQVDIFYSTWVMSRTKFKVLRWTKDNTIRQGKTTVTVHLHCTSI